MLAYHVCSIRLNPDFRSILKISVSNRVSRDFEPDYKIGLADMSRDRSQSVKIQNIFVDALYCMVDNHFELLNVQ